MIINSHVHVFPDKVAQAIGDKFKREIGSLYGTFKVSSLLADMKRCGIDVSLIFCIAERPEVVKPANDFIINVQDSKKLIGFGTIHPDFKEYEGEIKKLKAAGIKGIKFSSIFQGFYPDEDRMLRICEAMGEDMVAYFHAGIDLGRPKEEAHATPQRLLRVLELFPKMKIVAAHFGGLDMLEEARVLIGKNLYLDMTWTPTVALLDPKEVTRIVKEHGVHRVLFGTDYPVTDTREQIDWVASLPLTAEEKDLIFYRNAKCLLNL